VQIVILHYNGPHDLPQALLYAKFGFEENSVISNDCFECGLYDKGIVQFEAASQVDPPEALPSAKFAVEELGIKSKGCFEFGPSDKSTVECDTVNQDILIQRHPRELGPHPICELQYDKAQCRPDFDENQTVLARANRLFPQERVFIIEVSRCTSDDIWLSTSRQLGDFSVIIAMMESASKFWIKGLAHLLELGCMDGKILCTLRRLGALVFTNVRRKSLRIGRHDGRGPCIGAILICQPPPPPPLRYWTVSVL
jgi:hypothetical protein